MRKESIPKDAPFMPKGADEDTAFVVHDVLSAAECEQLIAEARELGMADSGYDRGYRNCLRLIAESTPIAEQLFARLRTMLASEVYTPSPSAGNARQGEWKLNDLNNRFRICMYEGTGHFGPHRYARARVPTRCNLC